jgi:hypothetical protein
MYCAFVKNMGSSGRWQDNGPAEHHLPGPGPQKTWRKTVDTKDSSAPAHPSTEEKKLAKLEDQLAHEIMDDEERQELRDRVLALRRRLSR